MNEEEDAEMEGKRRWGRGGLGRVSREQDAETEERRARGGDENFCWMRMLLRVLSVRIVGDLDRLMCKRIESLLMSSSHASGFPSPSSFAEAAGWHATCSPPPNIGGRAFDGFRFRLGRTGGRTRSTTMRKASARSVGMYHEANVCSNIHTIPITSATGSCRTIQYCVVIARDPNGPRPR